MRFLLNRSFQRDLKDNYLDESYVEGVLKDIFEGKATSLGSKLYKIRSAKKGGGKRGGFRNIFFWKRDELIVFCLLFGKNEQDNLSAEERKALKIWSDVYDRLAQSEIDALVRNNNLKEFNYDQ